MVPSKPGRSTAVRRTGAPFFTECARLEIDGTGRVRSCDELGAKLLRGAREDILGTHISDYVARFTGADLVAQGALQPGIAFLCRCGVRFPTLTATGEEILTQIFVNERTGSAQDGVRLLMREIVDGEDERPHRALRVS
jgi:hypothetical protein